MVQIQLTCLPRHETEFIIPVLLKITRTAWGLFISNENYWPITWFQLFDVSTISLSLIYICRLCKVIAYWWIKPIYFLHKNTDFTYLLIQIVNLFIYLGIISTSKISFIGKFLLAFMTGAAESNVVVALALPLSFIFTSSHQIWLLAGCATHKYNDTKGKWWISSAYLQFLFRLNL